MLGIVTIVVVSVGGCADDPATQASAPTDPVETTITSFEPGDTSEDDEPAAREAFAEFAAPAEVDCILSALDDDVAAAFAALSESDPDPMNDADADELATALRDCVGAESEERFYLSVVGTEKEDPQPADWVAIQCTAKALVGVVDIGEVYRLAVTQRIDEVEALVMGAVAELESECAPTE